MASRSGYRRETWPLRLCVITDCPVCQSFLVFSFVISWSRTRFARDVARAMSHNAITAEAARRASRDGDQAERSEEK